jgi:hypothetical protein
MVDFRLNQDKIEKRLKIIIYWRDMYDLLYRRFRDKPFED